MRIKRNMAVITVALTLVVAGCSGSDGDDSGGGGPVTLSYGIWDQNQAPAMEEIAAKFHEANPNIDVDIQVTPWAQYWTKLQAAAGSGAAPDVFWMDPVDFGLYASNGVLAPLSDNIDKDGVDTSVYTEGLMDLYTLGGEAYGLPKDFDTIGLWYNKTLFDAAGIGYPDKSWTWDDVHSAAAKLTDPSTGTYGLAATLTGQLGYYNTIFQAGGHVISEDGTTSGYDDPATIEGLRFWTDLIESGSSPTLQQLTDTADLQWFTSGKTAMFYGGSWQVSEFKKNESFANQIDVAPLPQGKERATVISGLANVVSANSAHADAAWEFVKYLGSKEAATIQAKAGTAIPAYEGTQQAWVDASPQFNMQIFLDETDYAQPYPISKNTAVWNELEAKYLTEAWDLKLPVSEAATELATDMDAALAEEAQ